MLIIQKNDRLLKDRLPVLEYPVKNKENAKFPGLSEKWYRYISPPGAFPAQEQLPSLQWVGELLL
jgi:hypothetical protein